MLKKVKYGFSLIEIIVAVVISIAIVALALVYIVQKTKMNETKTEKMTQSYYKKIENAYDNIISYNTFNNSISEINDVNSDNKQDNNDLRDLFNQYIDGKDVDCSKLGIMPKNLPGSNEVVCSYHKDDVITGYYLNPSCNTTLNVKETFTKSGNNLREVRKTCGYVLYGFRGSRGKVGIDVFIVPLDKDSIKK